MSARPRCFNVILIYVGVVGNHAAPLPSEVYWKNKLPNNPMPAILHDLLHPDQKGKAFPDIRAERPPPGSSNLYNRYNQKHKKTKGGDQAGKAFPDLIRAAGPPPGTSNLYNRYNPKHKSSISQQLNSNRYNTKPPSQQLNLNKYNTKPPSQQLNNNRYNTKPPSQQLDLNKYSNDPPLGKSTIPNQINDNAAAKSPGASLFFLEKDLYPGAKMNLHFVVSTPRGTTFLSQKLAKVTPFSSNKLPEILNQFSISPKSEEVEVINETIMDCEEPAIENEEKYCANSLESLVDYGTSKFGKNVNVLTTEIVGDEGKRTQMRKQQYVVSTGIRQIVSDNLVACHSLPYLYAIFYCHETSAHTAQAHMVPLVGADGTKIKATAVCHKDTSKWDPDHVAFQVLKVKPGTVPICHFLTEDNIVWAGKNKDN
ncbi:hypothetical protein MKX01_014589 [Papaver californicum]|nr:hypothetical protein MKX01_014589 [Papaver californicum]